MAGPAFDPLQHEDEQSLLARASWLYFAGGMTHGDIGERLGVPAFKVQRLIARATREGLIHVFVDSPVASCVRLEQALADRYGLDGLRRLARSRRGGVAIALARSGRRTLSDAGHAGTARTS